MEPLLIIGLIGLVVVAVASLAYHSWKAQRYIERWASDAGYVLESATQNNFTDGPWKGKRSGLYYVFHVVVIAGEERRSAWVRLGSSRFFGFEPIVIWDDAEKTLDAD